MSGNPERLTFQELLAGVPATPDKWQGELHTLIVHSVIPPAGPFDDGELEYDLEHPPSCREEETWPGGLAYTCDVAAAETDCGLPFALRYSGTPVTEPGTYRVQGWGRRIWCGDYGAWEYDGGISVVGIF